MARVNLFDWTDLLHYACTIGYHWNQAHDILVKDEVPPMYESRTTELYEGVGDDYGWSEDTCKIVNGFLISKKIKTCVIK
jgi:hypothetical protein